jgi:S-adenosylmethionine decarboxylase
MAFNDTLFQLGMDLTRSSTAQKEDHVHDVASVARENSGLETSHNEIRSSGRHLFIDLHGCGRLSDAKAAERALKLALSDLGKMVAGVSVNRVAGGTSLSGTAELSTGQLVFRGNAATGLVTIDVRGCSHLDSHAALFALAEAFGAREAVIQKTRRSDVVFLPAVKAAGKARKVVKAQRKAA